MTSRYFLPGCSLFCRACNRTGHLAKSCSFRKVNELTHQCCFHGHLQRFLNRTILKIFFVVFFFCLCVGRNILYVSFVGSKVTSKGNVQVAPVVDVDYLHTGSSHVICLQYGTSTACAAGWQGTFLMWVRRSGPFECWCCRVCYCAEGSVENIWQLFVDRFCNLVIVWAQFMKCCFISCKQFFVFLVVAWRKHFFSVFWIFLRPAPIRGDNTTWQWVLTALYLFFFLKSNLLYSAKCIITSLSGSMCKPNWSS